MLLRGAGDPEDQNQAVGWVEGGRHDGYIHACGTSPMRGRSSECNGENSSDLRHRPCAEAVAYEAARGGITTAHWSSASTRLRKKMYTSCAIRH